MKLNKSIHSLREEINRENSTEPMTGLTVYRL